METFCSNLSSCQGKVISLLYNELNHHNVFRHQIKTIAAYPCRKEKMLNGGDPNAQPKYSSTDMFTKAEEAPSEPQELHGEKTVG